MNDKNGKGAYIVLEGSDGTGKTTQASLLYLRLLRNGAPISKSMIAEPGRVYRIDSENDVKNIELWLDLDEKEHITSLPGYNIRSLIKDPDNSSIDAMARVLLHTAAHRIAWNEATLPALNRGEIVISSRGWLSTLAYQGYGDQVSHKLIKNVHQHFVGRRYLRPDLHFVLVSNDEAERKRRLVSRGSATEIDVYESRESDFQERVQIGYLHAAKKYGATIIDANRGVAEIHEEIWSTVVNWQRLHGLESGDGKK